MEQPASYYDCQYPGSSMNIHIDFTSSNNDGGGNGRPTTDHPKESNCFRAEDKQMAALIKIYIQIKTLDLGQTFLWLL
jgi:hypothetical protein